MRPMAGMWRWLAERNWPQIIPEALRDLFTFTGLALVLYGFVHPSSPAPWAGWVIVGGALFVLGKWG